MAFPATAPDSSLRRPSMGRLLPSFAQKGQGACILRRKEISPWVCLYTKAAKSREEIKSDICSLPRLSTRHTWDSQPDIAGRSSRLVWHRCWALQQRDRGISISYDMTKYLVCPHPFPAFPNAQVYSSQMHTKYTLTIP